MNRQELATKVRNLVNQAFLHGVDNKYYKGLMGEVEKLREPITLAEFLGWEVGVEYEDESGFTYRLKEPNDLQTYYDENDIWVDFVLAWSGYTIDILRQAEKIEYKKKYRIPLPNLVTTDGKQQYLTEKEGHWFASRLNPNIKQEWTEDEFHRIPTAYWGYAKEMVK